MQPNIDEGRFWVVHFGVFFLCMLGGVIYQWVTGAWAAGTWIGTLADTTGASFGCAFSVASVVEVNMVIYNRFFKPVWEEQRREEGRKRGREEGREEGLEEGREEGREQERQRLARLARERGIMTPELERLLTEGSNGSKPGEK